MKIFGTIKLKHNYWYIDTEPHVAMKMKRVFPQISQSKTFVISLSNTPQNCRDLEWFLIRYPMEVENRELLEHNSTKYQEHLETLEELVHGEHKPREFNLADCLEQRKYQRIAAELYLKQNSLLLADDVGLGKTAVAIMSMVEPKTLPALVVTLTHLPRQWEKEINKFAPKLITHIPKTGKPYKLPEIYGHTPDVIIMNYHKLHTWAHALEGYINSVVFDEIQELRRDLSLKYRAACRITNTCSYKLGLSATPIYNYGGEFFNVINALNKGILGSYEEFIREWCSYSWKGKGKESIKDPVAFGKYCREHFIMLRRTREDVGRELPEITRIPYTVESDTKPLDDATTAAAELAKIILKRVTSTQQERYTASGEFENIIRQATGIAKAPHVADFVRLLIESGEKVVLYGWHRAVYEIWKERLEEFNPVMYTGTENEKKKHENLNKFLSKETDIMIMSLRSGAGVDGLQDSCRTVVFGELDWSPGVHEQCIGRIHRDGQKEKVMAYYLISETGSDPIVADVLGVKREQVEGVRNPDAPLVEKLSYDTKNIKEMAENYLDKINV